MHKEAINLTIAQPLFLWLKKQKYHFLFWPLFIAYESLILYWGFGIINEPISYLHYIPSIIIFYFYSEYVLLWATRSTVIIRLPIIVLVWVVLYTLLHFLTDLALEPPFDLKLGYFAKNLYRALYFLQMCGGYYFFKTTLRERKKNAEMEQQRLKDIIERQQVERALFESQNAFLKAQINPHFLFNTLDFVYHQVYQQSPQAGEAIISLSTMMRYAIDSDHMGGSVYLREEIEQVENLLSLYRMRRGEDLVVEFTYDEQVKNLRFIPLALLTLVENMFKHGDLHISDPPAFIHLTVENAVFYLKTGNNCQFNTKRNSHRTGLENLTKRLHFAFGTAATLEFGVSDTQFFSLNLSIPLQVMM